MKNIKAIIIILVTCLIFGFLLNKSFYNKNQLNIGTIEGSLSYPSDEIPQNMEICAENIITKKQYCTTKHIVDDKYRYKVGYLISLPTGTYYVFAKSKFLVGTVWKDQKAFYSEFVICGMTQNCLSHDPIQVVVEDKKIITGIDPWDWYNN